MTELYYESYISHHGIKGMKWGIRRTQEQLGHLVRRPYHPQPGDVTLNRGTKFQRITTASNSGFTKGVYTSYRINDKDLYKGVLGRMRISYLDKNGDDVRLNEMTMTSRKAIHLPSKEVRVSEFKKLYESDPKGVLDTINYHEGTRYHRKPEQLFSPKDKGKVNEMYRKFNDALALGVKSKQGSVIKKYYKQLYDLGYDAIPDENDVRLSTFKAEAPIILFDTKQSVGKVTNRELSAGEVFSAYQRSIGKKTVRDLTRPGNIGFEHLNANCRKKSEEYAKQIKQDKFALNKDYSIADLAKDWNQNRLSTSQIKSVSKKMDSGKTHDESVAEVMAIGNVIADYLLDKKNL